jgi:hypothetical protein
VSVLLNIVADLAAEISALHCSRGLLIGSHELVFLRQVTDTIPKGGMYVLEEVSIA